MSGLFLFLLFRKVKEDHEQRKSKPNGSKNKNGTAR